MGGRKTVRGTRPAHLRATGKGWVQCQASGFIREADDMMTDVRQGEVSREFADVTPGFGTYHPQDVRRLGSLNDPQPIPGARPEDRENLSIQDLGISDQEVRLSIREHRLPRKGY